MSLLVKTGNTFREATREEILDNAARFLVSDARGTKITEKNAAELFRKAIGGYDREHVAVAFTNVRGRILSMDIMFKGTLDEAPMYNREVARRALELNASTVFIAHNHPSSQTAKPSKNDMMSTLRLAEALELVGVELAAAFVVTATDFTPIKPPEPPDLLKLLRGAIASAAENKDV